MSINLVDLLVIGIMVLLIVFLYQKVTANGI